MQSPFGPRKYLDWIIPSVQVTEGRSIRLNATRYAARGAAGVGCPLGEAQRGRHGVHDAARRLRLVCRTTCNATGGWAVSMLET
jgi:hypothetical protein